MLVSVDAEKGVVTVYGSSVIRVPIDHYDRIRALLAGKVVQYVSEVTEVAGEDVLEMIEELSGTVEYRPQPSNTVDADGRLWLHATGSGQIYVPLDGKKKLKFEGPLEFLPLEKYGYDIAEKYPQVKALLGGRKPKLEIVSTSKMNAIKRMEAKRMLKKEELKYRNADGTDIIVDTRMGAKNYDPRTQRGVGRGEPLDMDELVDQGAPTDIDTLSDDLQRVLAEGWGAQEDDGMEAEAE